MELFVHFLKKLHFFLRFRGEEEKNAKKTGADEKF
jgi:hypothetical protein